MGTNSLILLYQIVDVWFPLSSSLFSRDQDQVLNISAYIEVHYSALLKYAVIKHRFPGPVAIRQPPLPWKIVLRPTSWRWPSCYHQSTTLIWPCIWYAGRSAPVEAEVPATRGTRIKPVLQIVLCFSRKSLWYAALGTGCTLIAMSTV